MWLVLTKSVLHDAPPCAVIGSSFMNYLEAFKPFLLQGLKKIDEYQVRN